jgi:hypothetical protein
MCEAVDSVAFPRILGGVACGSNLKMTAWQLLPPPGPVHVRTASGRANAAPISQETMIVNLRMKQNTYRSMISMRRLGGDRTSTSFRQLCCFDLGFRLPRHIVLLVSRTKILGRGRQDGAHDGPPEDRSQT